MTLNFVQLNKLSSSMTELVGFQAHKNQVEARQSL